MTDTQQGARTAAEVLARGLWRVRPGLSAFNYWAKDEDDVVQKYPHGDSASRRRGSLKEAERLVAALTAANLSIMDTSELELLREERRLLLAFRDAEAALTACDEDHGGCQDRSYMTRYVAARAAVAGIDAEPQE